MNQSFAYDAFRFAQDIEKFTHKCESNMAWIIRETAIALHSYVVDLTPVLSGRAAANWQLTVGRPMLSEVDYSGTPRSARGYAKREVDRGQLRITGDDEIYIWNNLPYIVRLEYGWSKQAPEGMVRKATAEFPYIVERKANERN
jgi:hypothetical protein